MRSGEKIIGFESFFVANIAWEWILIKNTRVCLVYNISEIFKNFIFFKSIFFLRSGHDLSQKTIQISPLG